jgi:hypothetical protein
MQAMRLHAQRSSIVRAAKRLACGVTLSTMIALPAFARLATEPAERFGAVMEYDPSASPALTVYRPRDLRGGGFPIIAWGNGGCAADGGAESRRFLMEVASHGYVITAPGRPGPDVPIEPTANVTAKTSDAEKRPSPPALPPSGIASAGKEPWPTSPTQLIKALDWLVKEHNRPKSRYFGKLAIKKVAVMGRSCGGMQALSIESDPRIVTSMIWNSGLFDKAMPLDASTSVTKDALKFVHHPIAYINGGATDIAYANAVDDFRRLTNVPVFFGEVPVGHNGTMRQANGDSYAHVANMWLDWQLKGDVAASRTFLGSDCELCRDSAWKVQWKNVQLIRSRALQD